jgi:hypothetical protein
MGGLIKTGHGLMCLLNAADSRSFPLVKLIDGPLKRGDSQRGQRKREEESPGGWIQRVPWVKSIILDRY